MSVFDRERDRERKLEEEIERIRKLRERIKREGIKPEEIPKIIVVQDYDGYFEALVVGWIKKKKELGLPFNSEIIIITSGPWRPAAVAYHWIKTEKLLYLDFYSALRTGFGSLTKEEIEAIIDLL